MIEKPNGNRRTAPRTEAGPAVGFHHQSPAAFDRARVRVDSIRPRRPVNNISRSREYVFNGKARRATGASAMGTIWVTFCGRSVDGGAKQQRSQRDSINDPLQSPY
jgi:hypothetical protein